MATAETLPGPGELDDDQREAVELLLRRLADDEFVLAERYTEWQVRAPTLESDLALSNIAQDELGHARLWYDLLMDLGYEESDLVFERGHDGWRHSTLAELPFDTGDWADPIVRSYLYDVAEELRLAALADSSYERIASRVEKIQGEEEYHREHAENWMERLAEGDEGRERVQSAVDRLFPHALTIFVPGDDDVETRIDDLGLRTSSLAELREQWLDEVEPFLESLGVTVEDANLPAQYDVHHSEFDLPPAVGRDADHTDGWPELYDEFTRSYRELGRESADRIMKDPDDV
jgi:ring-1,2-phenylacetyl-CoA epoxidase subunit PaaC